MLIDLLRQYFSQIMIISFLLDQKKTIFSFYLYTNDTMGKKEKIKTYQGHGISHWKHLSNRVVIKNMYLLNYAIIINNLPTFATKKNIKITSNFFFVSRINNVNLTYKKLCHYYNVNVVNEIFWVCVIA